MDKTSQVIAILQDCKINGLNFYAARQVLTRRGYTDTEIQEATDQFDYQGYAPAPAQPITQNAPDSPVAYTPMEGQPSVAPPVPSSIYPNAIKGIGDTGNSIVPGVPAKDTPKSFSASNMAQWYIELRVQAAVLAGCILAVFLAGNLYDRKHMAALLVLYFCVLGVSASIMVYFNLIRNVRAATSTNQKVFAGLIGACACLVCFAFLAYVTVVVLQTKY